MKKITYLLIICIAANLYACQLFINCEEGKGNIVKKEIVLESFDEITIEGNYQLFLSQGESQKIYIESHENLIPFLNTEVNRGEWRIDFDPCVESSKPINIYATVVNLEKLNIEGSGSIKGESLIKSNQLNLNIDGSGEINLELDVKELESEVNGSGDIQLRGTTKKHTIEINGSGDVEAYDLLSDNCEIEINGSGDVKVNVSYDLKAEVNGSGDIYYKGSVKNINSSINGSGNLNQAE